MNPNMIESVALVMNSNVITTAFASIGVVIVCLAVAGFVLIRRGH